MRIIVVKYRQLDTRVDFSNPFTRGHNPSRHNAEELRASACDHPTPAEFQASGNEGRNDPVWRAPPRRLKRIVSTRIVKREISRRSSSTPALPAGLSKCAMNKLGRERFRNTIAAWKEYLAGVPRVLDNRIVSDVHGTITVDTTAGRTEGAAAVSRVEKKLPGEYIRTHAYSAKGAKGSVKIFLSRVGIGRIHRRHFRRFARRKGRRKICVKAPLEFTQKRSRVARRAPRQIIRESGARDFRQTKNRSRKDPKTLSPFARGVQRARS